MGLFGLLLAAVSLGRIFELRLSRKRIRALPQDCVPFDRKGNWPLMVALHVALLGMPLGEVLYTGRAPTPWLFWTCVVALLGTTALRIWTQRELGPAWNARGLLDPSLGFQCTGPYRLLRHPNYLAVLIEVFAIPLAGSAFLSLAVLAPAHIAVLLRRVWDENEALETLPGYAEAFAGRGNLFPKLTSHQPSSFSSRPREGTI